MYARLISSTQIDTNVPRRAMWQGQEIVGDLSQTPGLLESLHYYPLQTSEQPTPQDGYHAEPRYAYDDAESPTKIVQTWEIVQDAPPPPRTFSRLKLKLVLARKGLLQQFLAALQNIELVPNSGYMASDAFNDAVTLSEGFEGFGAAVAAIKTALGVTDEQVEAILAASVAE